MARAKINLMLVFSILLLFHQLADAQYSIQNSVFGNGGAVVENESYRIIGTVGQPTIGVTSNSANRHYVGFWYITSTYSPSLVPSIVVTPSPIAFGNVTVGEVREMKVSIGNTGTGELNITGIESDLDDILKISETAFTVSSNATHNITLTLTASTAGEISGMLTITSNDPDSPTEVAITGNAQTVGRLLADVSGDGTVSALDAALVLQFTVGLIDLFPVEDLVSHSVNSPNLIEPRDYIVRIPMQQAKEHERIKVPIVIDDATGLMAGGIRLKYDPTVLKAAKVLVDTSLNDSYLEANTDISDEVRFAFVSLQPMSGQGNLFTIEFEVLPNTEGTSSALILDSVDFFNSQTITKISGEVRVIPSAFALLQNYPNPFNPETWLPYKLAADAPVTIRIYNARGWLVRRIDFGNQRAGVYLGKGTAAYWNGRNASGEEVASGLYFYNLQAGDFIATKRMLIVK